MDAMATIYRPIKPYQTRLLRLHGDQGVPESPLICDLYPADILHPTFEGLGVRFLSDEDDCLIQYDALSYAWGDSNNKDTIICNGVGFHISQNLSEALRALRPTEETARWLWADAICINQSDDKEKSEQVWNMLMIYQKATGVVAWLGPAQEDIEYALAAASAISANVSQENELDFWRFLRGISYIYTRPYFQRIWIQQEIFAARNLTMRCGSLSFQWSQLLSEPNLLLELPQFRAHKGLEDNEEWTMRSTTPRSIREQVDALCTLDQLHQQKLGCFEQFSIKDPVQPDIIETLLDTSALGATKAKDYIYGILGITGFPAKPMPLQEWMMARRNDIFIPIDYSMDLASLLCAVTWVMLMKGGLEVLAKSKAFASENNATSEQPLPSWVIDWRLCGRLFRRHSNADEDVRNIDTAWHLVGNSCFPRPPPVEHEQFCEDNKGTAVPCTQIILRGTIDLGFYAKGRSVWKKESKTEDKVAWNLDVEVYQTDLVVYMHSPMCEVAPFWGGDYDDGPWLLRPTKQNQFQLVAYLSAAPMENEQPSPLKVYQNWRFCPDDFQDAYQQHSPNAPRGLTVNLVPNADDIPFKKPPKDSAGTRTFVII